MDAIIEKLAEIETTAEAIVDSAEKQKFEAEREIQAKRDEFDRNLNAETEKELDKIRTEGKKKMDQALSEERAKNHSMIDCLETEFNEHHTEYAKDILKHILEV